MENNMNVVRNKPTKETSIAVLSNEDEYSDFDIHRDDISNSWATSYVRFSFII